MIIISRSPSRYPMRNSMFTFYNNNGHFSIFILKYIYIYIYPDSLPTYWDFESKILRRAAERSLRNLLPGARKLLHGEKAMASSINCDLPRAKNRRLRELSTLTPF